MKIKVLCDFDGTISTEDISVLVLEYFAEGPWQQYEDLLEAGEITTEQGLPLEFKQVKSSKTKTLEKIKDLIVIRDGFEEFVQFCKSQELEMLIVGAGLDFVIEYVQQMIGINLPVISPLTIFGDGISFTFPIRYYPDSVDFKSDLVKHYQSIDNQVIFIGDGGSDFQGARDADFHEIIHMDTPPGNTTHHLWQTPDKDVKINYFCEVEGHRDSGMEGSFTIGTVDSDDNGLPGFNFMYAFLELISVAVIPILRKRN